METMLVALVSGVCSFAGAWGALSVKLQWLRRDMDETMKRVNRIEEHVIRGREGFHRGSGTERPA